MLEPTGYIRLHSGAMFNPLAPEPELITIEDIAYGVAGQFRFAGHSRYTVGQHSVLGSEFLGSGPEALAFLLHDSDEGLGLPDLARPVKYDPRFQFYRDAGAGLHVAVGKKFGVDFAAHEKQIKFIDDAMLRTEQHQLSGRKLRSGEVALPIKIEVWSPERAEKEFLQRFHLLTSPSTFTTGEYAASIGLARHAALGRLKKLAARGIVERTRVSQDQGGVVRTNVVGWRFLGSNGNPVVEVGRSALSGTVDPFAKDAEIVVAGYQASG